MENTEKQMVRTFNSKVNVILSKVITVLLTLRLRQKILKVKKHDRNLFNKIDSNIEKLHKKYWKPLLFNISPIWLRFYSNISKNHNYKYIPEDIFYTVVSRKLNDMNLASNVVDKCNYEIHYPGIKFPFNIIKNISGTFLNSKHQIISKQMAREKFLSIRENFIIKPSLESGGGINIKMVKYVDGKYVNEKCQQVSFDSLINEYKKDFLIQRIIRQHQFYAQFNNSSVNTLRVFTYRSVKDESAHVLSALIRMGRDGKICDNLSCGGIFVGVNIQNGLLDKYGFNLFTGEKYGCHPDSKVTFQGMTAVGIQNAILLAKKIVPMIPSQRILSLDIAITEKSEALLIELNTKEMGINMLQMLGTPLFAEFTDEILEYSKTYRDDFQYFRAKH